MADFDFVVDTTPMAETVSSVSNDVTAAAVENADTAISTARQVLTSFFLNFAINKSSFNFAIIIQIHYITSSDK